MSESLYTRVIIWVNTILIPYDWFYNCLTGKVAFSILVLISTIETMHAHIYWSIIGLNVAFSELRMVTM